MKLPAFTPVPRPKVTDSVDEFYDAVNDGLDDLFEWMGENDHGECCVVDRCWTVEGDKFLRRHVL